MSIQYDFSSLENTDNDKDKLDDPRENFRITQCCGNCRYYFYTGTNSRKGYCKLINLENVRDGAFHMNNIDAKAKEEGWLPTHSTNVCDAHEIRSQVYSIERIERWTRKPFQFDGSPDPNRPSDVFNSDNP